MNKQEKLLNKALNDQYDLTFKEFKVLLESQGWKYVKSRGSHEKWKSPCGKTLMIQNLKGKAKAYQVKQFIGYYEEELAHEETTY